MKWTVHDRNAVKELRRDLNETERMTLGRECGDCRLCCKVVNVEEVEDRDGVKTTTMRKKPGPWCKHACDKGCGIYETRPGACSGYRCLWLEGCLPDEYQPIKIGVVVHAEVVEEMNGPVWHVMEKRDGQVKKNRKAARLVAALVAQAQFPVVVLHGRVESAVVDGEARGPGQHATLWLRGEPGPLYVTDDGEGKRVYSENFENWEVGK